MPSARLTTGIAVLLIAHVALAFWAARDKGLAYDEIFHVTGGYLFDRYGDYRIHPDNGVLPQRVHGLAPWLAGAQPPAMDTPHWRESDQGVVGHDFFFRANADHRPWLLGARALNLIFSAGICLLVYLWARSLAGTEAGLVALALAAFSPTLLAHGALATSDAAAALLLGSAAFAFGRQLDAEGWRATGASALLFGAACVSKYSAAILIPVFAVLTAVHAGKCGAWGKPVAKFLLHLLGAWAVIWLAFGCRFAAGAEGLPPVDHFLRTWSWVGERAGWQGTLIARLREWHLLPEAFLFGYLHTYVGSLSRPAFLAGEFSPTGWASFFPLAFAWKSTLAELAGTGLAITAALTGWRGWRARLPALLPLLLLGAAYGLFSVASKLNIGHRHLLPLYPLLFVATGVAVVSWKPLGRWMAGGLVCAQIAAAGWAIPNYLAYFNPISGGPGNGWRLLVDSSLDWGQELPALHRWLEANNAGGREPVFISYFGSDQPEFHGIRAARLPFITSAKFRQRWYEPRAGLYCVSATMLQQVYGPGRGLWTAEFESQFRTLRLLEAEFRRQADAGGRLPEELYAQWELFDQLRFARLCQYLKVRRPEAVINHGIFVYRLDEAELDRVIRGDAAAWAAAIEAAAGR